MKPVSEPNVGFLNRNSIYFIVTYITNCQKRFIQFLSTLFILNLLDLVFTVNLLKLEVIEEQNVLMDALMKNNIYIAIIVKLGVFLLFEAAIYICYVKAQKHNIYYYKKISIVISICLIIIALLYLYINFIHIYAIFSFILEK